MEFVVNNTFFVIEKLIAFAIILQTIEFFIIKKSFSQYGVWRWQILKQDYSFLPEPIQKGLKFVLGNETFLNLVIVRGIAAIVLLIIPSATMTLFLFFSSLLISMRWRGTFNGGSDCMVLIVLLALSVQNVLSTNVTAALFATWFIAVHAISSYFIAGIVKLRSNTWRQGDAVALYLQQYHFATPQSLKSIVMNPQYTKAITWAVMAFEVTFPLCLLNPKLCIFYLCLGVTFHLINFFAFGLNRFFWTWISTYPAILVASYLI